MSRRILVIAPHPDDETLGAGGAIAKWAADGDDVTVLVVSGHLPPLYPADAFETTVAEAQKAFALLGVAKSRFLRIPATQIGNVPVHEFNAAIESVVSECRPHVVLCPFPDRHIDHRQIFDAVQVATRPVAGGQTIEILAAYETLSETHWNAPHIEPNFTPNWIVDVSAQIDLKIAALACYESQIPPFPGARSLDACRALAQFRGTQAGFAYGEGFHVIRMIS
jgi:LmbE family N-acetylglucosaminyl deacetylase